MAANRVGKLNRRRSGGSRGTGSRGVRSRGAKSRSSGSRGVGNKEMGSRSRDSRSRGRCKEKDRQLGLRHEPRRILMNQVRTGLGELWP